MTGVNNSLTWTQSDATSGVVSAESCYNVLDTSPQHYTEKISRYLEFSVGQSTEDGPVAGDSDSGDSLFITQMPVPEAVRSGRRRHHSSKPRITASRDPGESGEDDPSSSSSSEEPKTDKERKRKKYTLPEYSFPFLAERKRKRRGSLLPVQNTALHRHVMAGFFTCVRKLQQRGEALPTVDTDGESIPPLSEEDEERPEDIRVVERKYLVAPLKAKSQQAWGSLVKPQKKKKAANTSQETNHQNKTPVRVDAERTDGHEIETPKTTRRLSRGNRKVILRREDDEPRELLRSPRKSAQQDDVFQTGQAGDAPECLNLLPNNNDDSVCSETKAKKRKKKKKDKGDNEIIEKGMGQTAATGVNVKVEETEENRAEPPGLNEEAQKENLSHDDILLGEEERDSNIKKKKKKRRKEKCATENDEQEVSGNLESDVREDDSVVVQDGGEEKKKKKKRKRSEQLESDPVVEPLNAEIHKKKKRKRKKEEEAPSMTLSALSAEPVDESGNSLETLEAHVKRKKHKKKRQSSFNDASQEGEESVDLNFCIEDSVTSAKGSEATLKKKKKKTILEGLDVFNSPEKLYENSQKTKEGTEDQSAEVAIKKKKKRKSEISSRSVSEDSVAQSDDSVSVREKEKKRNSSFLLADAEENSVQTQPVEKPVDVEELNDEVTKKKKKRKKSEVQDGVEKDPGWEFEEPNKTCLNETADTEVKRKKKRAENESDTERVESAADGGLCPAGEVVMLKKKKKKSKDREKGTEETVNMAEHASDTSGHALNDIREKKKKKKKKAEIH